MIWNFSTTKQGSFDFFLRFARKNLLLLKFCQMREILKPQFCWYFYNVLLCIILMEVKVLQVGYFQITGRWICYSICFDISFMVLFTRLLSKNLWRNYPFSAQFSKNPFQDIEYYRKLRCLALWYWNGDPFSVLGTVFSEVKKCWYFEFY